MSQEVGPKHIPLSALGWLPEANQGISCKQIRALLQRPYLRLRVLVFLNTISVQNVTNRIGLSIIFIVPSKA